MRGMVMEVKGNTLVVLTSQGNYIRIKNNGTAAIGDFVPCDAPEPFRIHWIPRNALAFAASLMLICSAGLGAYGYSQPFGIVSIDINPSITLTYNWFEQVIDVEALNPDAVKLLPELGNLKNKRVPEAVEIVLNAASQAGYLKTETANAVFISVSDKNSKGRTTALLNTIDHDLAKIPHDSETVLMSGTPKIYEQVKQTHSSPIKELVESSLNSKPENDPVAHSSKPLKDILKEQKEKRDKLQKPQPQEQSSPYNPSDDVKNGPDKKNENPSNDEHPKNMNDAPGTSHNDNEAPEDNRYDDPEDNRNNKDSKPKDNL